MKTPDRIVGEKISWSFSTNNDQVIGNFTGYLTRDMADDAATTMQFISVDNRRFIWESVSVVSIAGTYSGLIESADLLNSIECDPPIVMGSNAVSTLTEAEVNTEADTALSDFDMPTNTEMEARTLPAVSYFEFGVDTVDAGKISGSTSAADSVEANIDNLDAEISTRSSHTAADVWTYVTRTLTDYAALIAGFWDYLAVNVTTSGSMGKQIKDNLDAVVSTRATSAALTSVANAIGSFTGSGINTIKGFLLAMTKKDASNPSDVGGTYEAATDSLEASRERMDEIYEGSGSGSNSFYLTVKEDDTGGATIQEITVHIMDVAQTQTYANTKTGTTGQANLKLDAGTYSLFLRGAGYQTIDPGNPVELVVSDTTDQEAYMSVFSPGQPVDINACRVYTWLLTPQGLARVGDTFTAQLIDDPASFGSGIASYIKVTSTVSNEDGYVYIDLFKSASYNIWIDKTIYQIKTPGSANSENLKDIIVHRQR